jgi:hypothetical protein
LVLVVRVVRQVIILVQMAIILYLHLSLHQVVVMVVTKVLLAALAALVAVVAVQIKQVVQHPHQDKVLRVEMEKLAQTLLLVVAVVRVQLEIDMTLYQVVELE